MGLTPNLKLPYPEPSEQPVGDDQIEALAMALDGSGTGAGAGATGIFLIGELRALACAPPTGWVPCNGAALSRTQYARLFAAIGTGYGAGDGVNTFNVPNTAGRALVGAGGSRAAGAVWGADTVTLDLGQVPNHTHYVPGVDHLHAAGSIYATDHAHHFEFWTGGANRGNHAQMGGGAEQIAYLNHQHWISGGSWGSGNLWCGGATAAMDRSPASWSHGPSLAAGSAPHENAQPSVAVPIYIYAGA